MSNIKKYLGWLVVAVVFLVGSALANKYINPQKPLKKFGVSPDAFNLLDPPMNHIATTTAVGVPVKLLARNYNRQYMLIVNDSDTVGYIYLSNFASSGPAAVSTTINAGIRVNANGGSYEMTPAALYIGDVWATSTASGKNFLITEK